MQEKFNDIILDLGVSIPLRPIFGITPRFVMKAPYSGTLLRISKLYLSMGIEKKELENMTYEQVMEAHVKHGRKIAMMVAYAIMKGYIRGLIFAPLLSYLLLWRMKPDMLHEAWYQLLTFLDTKSFIRIIRSADQINLMKPKLSQVKKGS